MRYQKAMEILPEELVELIQNYVDGEYVYIPRKQENKKNWGETSKVREELRNRNLTIYREYTMGAGQRTGEAVLPVRKKHTENRSSIEEGDNGEQYFGLAGTALFAVRVWAEIGAAINLP